MKVEQINPEPKFKPVVITLENQEEVDAIYTLVNHKKILEVFPVLIGWCEKLGDFGRYAKYWSKLCGKIN